MRTRRLPAAPPADARERSRGERRNGSRSSRRRVAAAKAAQHGSPAGMRLGAEDRGSRCSTAPRRRRSRGTHPRGPDRRRRDRLRPGRDVHGDRHGREGAEPRPPDDVRRLHQRPDRVLLHRRRVRHGGYEADLSRRGHGNPSHVAPECERLLVETGVRAAEELFPDAAPWAGEAGWTATGSLPAPLPPDALDHPARRVQRDPDGGHARRRAPPAG